MFIDFSEFVKNTESVVEEVFRFVGVQPEMAKFRPLPPGMKVRRSAGGLGFKGCSRSWPIFRSLPPGGGEEVYLVVLLEETNEAKHTT